ncbi:MAG: P-loop NTPase [Candidatus Eisenbacteria bacterium]
MTDANTEEARPDRRAKTTRHSRKLGRGLSQVSHVFLSGATREKTGTTAGIDDAADIRFWLPDARLISITSGAGVCGKSMVAANIGFGLYERGRKVAFVDADSDSPGIMVITGSVLAEAGHRLMKTNEAFGNIVMVGTGARAEASAEEGSGSTAAAGHIEEAARQARTVLVDTSPRAESSLTVWQLARLILVITEPATESMQASYATIKRIRSASRRARIGVIVNKAKDHDEAEQCFRKISNVSRRFLKINIRNCGFIVHSDDVREACERAVPLSRAFPGSRAARCMNSILALIVMDESAIARRRREVTVEACASRGGQ